ncbi:MAG: glycerophosphodiester phosphodiesterase [Elusimicrobia bacterium]|nr:glycerophosphodiester phosphodiesterase [Elusimicrobiota bacterium]
MTPAGAGLRLIAHRGASGYAPENTLASFRKCLDMGASSIEFDVQQTSDHRLVIVHDLNLKRLAGVRRALRTYPYAELSGLDVGRWFGRQYLGERVPLLEQLFDLVESRGSGAELQLEIKNGRTPYAGIEKRALDLVSARPSLSGRVVYSSFDHAALKRLRSLSASARIGYLAGSMERRASAIKDASALGCESLHLSLGRADRTWVEACHAANLRVFVYTVNEAADCRRLEEMGVDAVFTNFPDVLSKR